MIFDIVRFEWRYHTRQLSYLGASVIFLVLGFFFAATGFGQPGTNVNAPVNILESSGLLSLAAVFVAAVFCTSAIVRDRETKLEEIIFSTSATRSQFLLGRFFGAFFATATAVATCLVGMIAGVFAPIRPGLVSVPLEPLHYLYAFATMILPNVFFITVLLFAAAALTRSAVATYTTSIFIYVFYMVTAMLTDSPMMAGANREASIGLANALADPFGLAAYFAETRYWSVGEKNNRLLSMSGQFLFNRLLWLSVAAIAGGILFRSFTFGLLEEKRKRKPSASVDVPLLPYSAEVHPQRATVSPSGAQGFWKTTGVEIKLLMKSRAFAILTIVWCFLALIELVSDTSVGEYGAATFPVATAIFQTLAQPLKLLGLVLIIYFSGEVVWRERNAGMIDVVNATPQPSGAFVGAKWLALTAMVAVMAIAGLLTAVALQLFHRFAGVDPIGMLKFLAMATLPMAAVAAAAVLIHTVSPSRNAGLLLVLALVLMIEAARRFDLHPLLQFANTPSVGYSDMNGFRGVGVTFAAWSLHWSIAAAILGYLASTWWRRGLVVKRSKPFLTASFGAFLVTGSALFYDTNIAKDFTTNANVLAWKADYEKKYGEMRKLARPNVAHLEATIDLYPDQERAHTSGRLELHNRSGGPIERLLVAVRNDASNEKLSVDGATIESHDAEFNQYIFRFERPLAPGARANLRFDLTYDEPGLRSGDMPVTTNGTMMQSFRLFPSIGYRRGYEIIENDIRTRYGLPIVERVAVSEESLEEATDDWVTTDITLSTSGDETAVVTGELIRRWSAAGRSFFRYRTADPVRYAITVASGRFSSARATQADHAVEIFYHPGHAANVRKILDTTVASLSYQEANFGPYPHPALRIVEIPSSYQLAGYAQPGVIYLGERRLFQIDPSRSKGVDVVARRVAHEVAHQWWGHGVAPAGVEGGLLITESLAKYSELMITEKMFGPEHTRRQLDFELDRYLGRRGSSAYGEPPLSRVRGEAEIYYAKGAIVLNAIRHLIGEGSMNRALRDFYAEHSGPQGRATAGHLIGSLKRAAATDEQRALIDRWMNDVAVYDLRIEKASARAANGGFEVTATIDGSRLTVDAEGKEQRSVVGENVPFAILGANGKVLHRGQIRLDGRQARLGVAVRERPELLAIDPDLTRIDPTQRDNQAPVTVN